MEKKNCKIKENVATSVSSITGAAIGVVGANVVAQSVNAAEVTGQDNIVTQPTKNEPPSDPVHQQESHNTTITQSEPTPAPQEPQVEVLSYETVTNADNSQSDFTVIAVDGQPVIMADVDADGIADIMASDLNLNGKIEENEMIDISNEEIAMQPFQQSAIMNNDDVYLASNDASDYVNDANVDAYMA